MSPETACARWPGKALTCFVVGEADDFNVDVSHPVASPFLLPFTLDVEVMEAVTVQLSQQGHVCISVSVYHDKAVKLIYTSQSWFWMIQKVNENKYTTACDITQN